MIVKKLDIKNTEECKKWENFVLKNGYIYQSSKWITVLKHFNFEDYFLFIEENNKIISVFPLFHVKLPFIKNELVSIPHVEAGGQINPEYYRYYFNYINLNIKAKNLMIFQYKEKIGDFVYNDINSVFWTKVPEDEDGILKLFRKILNRSIINIQKKHKIEFLIGNSDEFINTLYDFNIKKHKEFGVPHLPYDFLKSLIDTFKDDCEIFIPIRKNKKLGAGLIIHYGGKTHSFYMFVPYKNYKYKIGLLLYFQYLLSAYKRGNKIFFYGRSPKGTGAYIFKKRMKANEDPLYLYYFNIKKEFKDTKIKTASEKFSWGTKIWKALPHFITNLFSLRLRKWIY